MVKDPEVPPHIAAQAPPRSPWLSLWAAVGATVPAVATKLGVVTLSETIETVFFGLGILGAAFLLAWAAEVAQLDISKGLAIAFLAFIAVLPEYAVDLVFAWTAGAEDAAAFAAGAVDPCTLDEECNRQLAIANMTGANRLLIGIGWSVVVLLWWKRSGQREIALPEERRLDLGFLLLATIWALVITIRASAYAPIDTVILVGLFAAYVWHTAKEAREEPHLIGPPLAIAAFGVTRRRIVTVALFLYSATVILLSAHPFAEGLKHIGETFGISQFLLVQWLAPLASEAPEMLIAILLVVRSKPTEGLGMLVSSKVNQWTLLVGTLPLVYALSYGSATVAFHLGDRQVEEVLLTAAQSLFAVAVLANLRIARWEAVLLLVLFISQAGLPMSAIRYGFSATYLALFVVLIARHSNRTALLRAVRAAVSKPRAPAAR